MRSRYPYRPSGSDISYSFGPGPITPVVKALIIANVVAFAGTALAEAGNVDVIRLLGLRPLDFLTRFQLWRGVTYLFLHANIFHILFNMLALWMFGVEMERRWGSRYFLKYYFVCGIGAAVTVLVLSLLPLGVFAGLYNSLTIGASGAVYGLLLAYGLYFPTRPIVMFFVFPVPAKYAVMIMGAIALYSSMGGQYGGVAHTAHLGGLIAGYLFLKGGRLHLLSEIQYRVAKWRVNRIKRRFDVYEGGRRRADDVDRRVH
jgi:membrane associated rhomboid family serine protease